MRLALRPNPDWVRLICVAELANGFQPFACTRRDISRFLLELESNVRLRQIGTYLCVCRKLLRLGSYSFINT